MSTKAIEPVRANAVVVRGGLDHCTYQAEFTVPHSGTIELQPVPVAIVPIPEDGRIREAWEQLVTDPLSGQRMSLGITDNPYGRIWNLQPVEYRPVWIIDRQVTA